MDSELVFENEYYSVVTAKSVSGNGLKVYKIINRQYDLVEVETTILVRAIQLAREYATYLTDMNKQHDIPDDDEDIVQFDIPPEEMEVVLDGMSEGFKPEDPSAS